MVYGANDGIITTFAVIAGAAGASLDVFAATTLAVANLLADGFSMAASDYLGSKSEEDVTESEFKEEVVEIDTKPDVERGEMVVLLKEQGYEDIDAQALTALMFKNKHFFTDLMMHEEHNLSLHGSESASHSALVTFFSFVFAGAIPLIPLLWVRDIKIVFYYSIVMTTATLFCVGALRSIVTRRGLVYSGLQMLFVGGVAALLAYGIGALLRGVIGIV